MSDDKQILPIKVAWKYQVHMCLALIESETQNHETKQIARSELLRMGSALDKLEDATCHIDQ